MSETRPTCMDCGRRPVPSRGPRGGPVPKRCLACSRDRGHRYDRTLERILKRDGETVARAEAEAGGVEFPDHLVGPLDAPLKPKAPTSLDELLMAAALGINPDPQKAAQLVGIDLEPKALKRLAQSVKDHPLRRADAAFVSRLIAQAGAATAVRTLEAAGRGDSARAARLGQACERIFSTHQELTGGMRPLPPNIVVHFPGAADG